MEERLRFIRSDDPFKGLDDYLNVEELRIKNSKIQYPLQLSLDGLGYDNETILRKKLGYYFEYLSNGIFGGRLLTRNQSMDSNGINSKTVRNEPDIIDHEKNHLRDSKAVSLGRNLLIYDDQLAKYLYTQLSNPSTAPPRITFEIFRYGIRHLISDFGGKPLEDLVNDLSSSTRFMLSLPLSIILAANGETGKKYSKRYRETIIKDNSRLFSSGLNAMLAYPEETISAFGLDPTDYQIQKLKFPQNVTMNGKQIRPFPVLHVRDKDRSKWVEKLRENESKMVHKNVFMLKLMLECILGKRKITKEFLNENFGSSGSIPKFVPKLFPKKFHIIENKFMQLFNEEVEKMFGQRMIEEAKKAQEQTPTLEENILETSKIPFDSGNTLEVT